jgi:hypothetical protein
MPSIGRRGLIAALAVSALVCALLAYGAPAGSQYLLTAPCHPMLCDDAGPSVAALSDGDLHGFFSQQPPMGSVSLLVRAPFAAVAKAAGGHDLAVYRAGAFACLLGLGLLAVWTLSAMVRRGRPLALSALVAAAVVVSPLTYTALQFGHPEELLAAALSAGDVAAAGRGRTVGAGLLLGCAVATKQWALLVVPVALVAAPAARARLVASAAGGAGLFTLPMLIADPSRFWLAQKSVSVSASLHNAVTASNVWFPFAHGSTGPTLTANGMQVTTQYSVPGFAAPVGQGLVVLLALAAIGAYLHRRRGAHPEEALQLLALILLVRCLLDPSDYSYHHAPFLVSLTVYEGLRRRVPVMTGFAIAAILLMTHVIVPMRDATLVNAFYLAWSLPLVAALAVGTFAPERLASLSARARALVARPAAA